jgi:purine-nucleoside phosphorylase
VNSPLDTAVRSTARSLREQDVPAPDVLFLLGTGRGQLPSELEEKGSVPLAGAPLPWAEETLSYGRLGRSSVWILEDLGDDPRFPPADPWRAGFPVWLAAHCGATLLVHTSAGSLLHGGRPELEPGGFALVSDHLNLSGFTPLQGLGESTLGPLFPDISQLHHEGLRLATLERAAGLGIRTGEAILACTSGPSLETAAERAWFASTGADVAAQMLSAPIHSAAHAGLAALFIVAVTDAGERPVRVQRIARVAEKAQPMLERLLLALAPDLEVAVARLNDAGQA